MARAYINTRAYVKLSTSSSVNMLHTGPLQRSAGPIKMETSMNWVICAVMKYHYCDSWYVKERRVTLVALAKNAYQAPLSRQVAIYSHVGPVSMLPSSSSGFKLLRDVQHVT